MRPAVLAAVGGLVAVATETLYDWHQNWAFLCGLLALWLPVIPRPISADPTGSRER